MRHEFTLRFRGSAVVLAGLAAGLSTVCAAQPGRRLESPPSRSLVTIIRVKPEMINEWLDLQKNSVVPELKKAAVKTRTVYSSGIFGSAFEYFIIQPMMKFAEFDAPEAQAAALGSVADARMAERLRKCVVSTSSFLRTALPALSDNFTETKNPSMVGFLRLRVAPGKMEEYETLFKSEVLPALKKVNSGIMAASRRLGTDGYDLTFETPMTKFADLDAPPPLVLAAGPEGAARLAAKFNGIATVVENTVLIRQADLSF